MSGFHPLADPITPDRSVMSLSRMPNQVHVWASEDDWSGVTNQNERRRLQNRQNQRAYRLRRQGDKPLLRESTPDVSSEEDSPCTVIPPHAREFRQCFETIARQSYLHSSPKTEHLVSLTRLNVHRAINENISAIGMTSAWMKSDDSVSIFNLPLPGLTEDCIPSSLRPTLIQRTIPHHPWLDFFPFPQMRDRLILAGDGFDDEELCRDLMAFWDTRNTGATLLVWGQPWDPRNWEITEIFAAKWGWLLRGSPEVLTSTNSWRRNRGEKPLVWRDILTL